MLLETDTTRLVSSHEKLQRMKEKTKQLLDLEVQQQNLDNETQPAQDLAER